MRRKAVFLAFMYVYICSKLSYGILGDIATRITSMPIKYAHIHTFK